MSKTMKVSQIRIRIITGMVLFVTIILIVRLYMIQFVYGEDLRMRADRQYVRSDAQIFDRGAISFTTKDNDRYEAASLKTGYVLAINPRAINDPVSAYQKLSQYIELDKKDFIKRASKDDPYEEIMHKINGDVRERIEQEEIPGVAFYKERWRYYPGNDLAAHTLGFLAYRGDEYTGQYGLERQYNDVLERNKGSIYANFFVELFSGVQGRLQGEEGEGSLVTTIEPDVQAFTQQELADLFKQSQTGDVGAIIMDPQNGEILSMATYPSFDVNDYRNVDDISQFTNPLVSDVYEMGSVIKPLTVAIGLDTKKITPDTVYNDTGSVTLDGHTFYNYDLRARGLVDIQEVLNNSLNTGVAFIVEKVGKRVFGDYMKRLLGDVTGVDLPNEASPQVANLDSPRDIEYATASFGQGIAITPLAAVRALATLGNGGKLVEPHVVREIKYEIGHTKKIHPHPPTQVFREETSEEISRMLVDVVDDALAGGTAKLPQHTIAAKTGTAQIADDQGGYYEDKFMHTFFGYFPAFEPRFIIFLYAKEPQEDYASQSLTQPFMNITKFLINHYEIPPDR